MCTAAIITSIAFVAVSRSACLERLVVAYPWLHPRASVLLEGGLPIDISVTIPSLSHVPLLLREELSLPGDVLAVLDGVLPVPMELLDLEHPLLTEDIALLAVLPVVVVNPPEEVFDALAREIIDVLVLRAHAEMQWFRGL